MDEDLEKMAALSLEPGFDLHTKVTNGNIGTAFGFGRIGFYSAAFAAYGDVLVPEAEAGDSALHMALRNDKIKSALQLIALSHPLNDCFNAQEQYIAELGMEKLDNFDQLLEKRGKVGFADLSPGEQQFLRTYEDDFEVLREKLKACVARFKVMKVQMTRKRLVDIFHTCHPSKLPEVDEIMEQYEGREDELMDDLERKYNPNYVPKYQGDHMVKKGYVDEDEDDDDEYM